MRGSLVSVLVLMALLAGCSNSGSGSKANPSVALVPPSGLSLSQGANLNISAHVDNDATGAGVTWTLIGDGALLNPTPFAVTYVAPSTSIGNSIAVVTATSLANSGAQSYVPITLLPPNVLDNVQPISV
ncbi:MAG TPA: hypothetical protein VLL05_08750, partial [Terriglobales bacterium]|nr:hypothetical protein [Terriglobales bacterium]